MPRDPRTFITVHDGMPEHAKIEPLTDAAFRLIIETWCYCSRNLNDGRITAAAWSKRGTQRTRRELIASGLVEVNDDGTITVHDYTEHQRTAAEVTEQRNVKAASGQAGAHRRWHKGKRVEGCALCYPDDQDQLPKIG